MTKQPAMIGIYGVSGCGKTFLSAALKEHLDPSVYSFYDGSEVIANIVPGGLETFKEHDFATQHGIRVQAVDDIKLESTKQGKHAIITGHFSFWKKQSSDIEEVYTGADLRSYTHIIYLQPSAEIVMLQCRADTKRARTSLSVKDIRQWQTTEVQRLHKLAQEHDILLTTVRPNKDYISHVSSLIQDFTAHNTGLNEKTAEARLDNAVIKQGGRKTIVLDADKTIAPADASALYWKKLTHLYPLMYSTSIMKDIFSSKLAYSYLAFRQAMLRYEESAAMISYEDVCDGISQDIQPYSEIVDFLQRLCSHNVNVIVITCGIKDIWEKVLAGMGLSSTVSVIGGCRLRDGYVMTPDLKGHLVARLQKVHAQHVTVLGDSPVDMRMLKQADQAVIIVGNEAIRSESMIREIEAALALHTFSASQVLLPPDVEPLLEAASLPIMTLAEIDPTGADVVAGAQVNGRLDDLSWVQHMTDSGAGKLLMSPTRDAACAGPTLRKAHSAVGKFLALSYITEILGTEGYKMQHVQAHMARIDGFRLRDEAQTMIIAMMRAGEPMASGVNEAFPTAQLLHAKHATDIETRHLEDIKTVILVDAVINTGKTIIEIVDRLQILSASVRIVIVAGVVQRGCLIGDGPLATLRTHESSISLVALRLSDNKYTGKGGTDTGNRLFNTTHLE